MKQISYAIVTPAYNEGAFLPRVIDAIVAQRVQPKQWIILDDRSTDNTWEILQQAAQKHAFIRPVQLKGKGDSVLGAHVARIFTQGMSHVPEGMDFVVKMDADIVLPENYFSELFRRFEKEPRLGIASGKIFIEHQGEWIQERFPDFHVPGACKLYRFACYRDIGGVIPVYGWDILDGVKARMRGWTTCSYPDMAVHHLRMMGSRRGMIRGHIGHGRGMYAVRAHPLFVLARSLYRAMEPPYLSGLMILFGYFVGMMRKEPRLPDLELAAFLRKEQLGRLLGRKLRQEAVLVRRLKHGK